MEIEEEPDGSAEGSVSQASGSQTNKKLKRPYGFGVGADEIFGSDQVPSQIPSIAKKQEKQKERKATKPHSHVEEMMGEANKLYSEKKFEEATKLLLQVAQENSNIPDPYNILGMIFEENNQVDEAIKCYMIAAHMQRKNVDLWEKLANMSQEKGDLEQTIYCYSKMLKVDPEDVEILWKRSELCTELGKYKQAIEGYIAILNLQPTLVNVILHLTRVYHTQNMTPAAITMLESSLFYIRPDLFSNFAPKDPIVITEKLPNSETEELSVVNILCELYMSSGSWEQAKEIISKAEHGFPIPLDLSVKYGICEAYLGNVSEAGRIFEKLYLLEDIDEITEYADLIFNIAETYVAISRMDMAINYYRKLLRVKTYDNPSTLIKIGNCLQKLNQLEAAIEIYEKILATSKEPNSEVVIALSDLYIAVGKMDTAVDIVNQFTGGTVDTAISNEGFSDQNNNYLLPDISHLRQVAKAPQDKTLVPFLARKSLILFSQGKYNQFLELALPILCNEELREGGVRKKIKSKPKEPGESMPKRKRRKKQKESPDALIIGILGINNYFMLLVHVLQVLGWNQYLSDTLNYSLEELEDPFKKQESERSKFACEVLQGVLSFTDTLETNGFNKNQLRTIQWFGTKVALKAGDFFKGMKYIKALCASSPHEIALWNKFCVALAKTKTYSPSNSYMRRLLKKNTNSIPLHIMAGHMNLTASYFSSQSLPKYLRAYFFAQKSNVQIPLLSLSLGIAYLNLVMHKNTPDRQRPLLLSLSFFSEYYNQRGKTIEAVYNLGRAFHQLNLVQFAVPLYKKVLNFEEDPYDIKMNAAYNLSIIYKESGSLELAREVIRQYLTI